MEQIDPYEKYQHSFLRDRGSSNDKYCYICHNKWPNTSGVIAKYHSCSTCGLVVHTACRFMAKRCYPCSDSIQSGRTQLLKSLSALKDLHIAELEGFPTCDGRVIVKLLHAYDMNNITPGTSLYGSFKFKNDPTKVLNSDIAVVGDSDCIWPGNASGTVDNEKDCLIHKKYGNNKIKSSSSTADLNEDGDATLTVDIWKSVMVNH